MLDNEHDGLTVTEAALQLGTHPDSIRRSARRAGVLRASVNGSLQIVPRTWVLAAKRRYARSGFMIEPKPRRVRTIKAGSAAP
jgi:hypothetical protein